MTTFRMTQTFGLTCFLALVCLTACGHGSSDVAVTRADGTSLSADDKAAAEFVRLKLAESWAQSADGWTTEFQQRNVMGQVMPGQPNTLYKQVREMSFVLSPDELTDAIYRVEAVFKDSPARFYRIEGTYEGPAG